MAAPRASMFARVLAMTLLATVVVACGMLAETEDQPQGDNGTSAAAPPPPPPNDADGGRKPSNRPPPKTCMRDAEASQAAPYQQCSEETAANTYSYSCESRWYVPRPDDVPPEANLATRVCTKLCTPILKFVGECDTYHCRKFIIPSSCTVECDWIKCEMKYAGGGRSG